MYVKYMYLFYANLCNFEMFHQDIFNMYMVHPTVTENLYIYFTFSQYVKYMYLFYAHLCILGMFQKDILYMYTICPGVT